MAKTTTAWKFVPCKAKTGNVQPVTSSGTAFAVHKLKDGVTVCGTYSPDHGLAVATKTMLAMRVNFKKTKSAVTCARCLGSVKPVAKKTTKKSHVAKKPAQNAPVTSAAQATPKPLLDAERTKDLPVPASAA